MEENRMLAKVDKNFPYIIFKLRDTLYALSSEYVVMISVLPEITPVIGIEGHCKGIMLFDGESVPVYDLRTLFGCGDYAGELGSFMQARIQDHQNWVDALEQSVLENTEFTLTTDPHKCAFGKWYDSFKTENGYRAIFLKSIDEPHKAIHQTGEHVKQLMRAGKQAEALAEIETMKTTHFARTTQLLSQVQAVYTEGMRDMLILFQCGQEQARQGIIVDEVCGIQELTEMHEVCNVEQPAHEYIDCIATSKDGGRREIIQVINPNTIA